MNYASPIDDEINSKITNIDTEMFIRGSEIMGEEIDDDPYYQMSIEEITKRLIQSNRRIICLKMRKDSIYKQLNEERDEWSIRIAELEEKIRLLKIYRASEASNEEKEPVPKLEYNDILSNFTFPFESPASISRGYQVSVTAMNKLVKIQMEKCRSLQEKRSLLVSKKNKK